MILPLTGTVVGWLPLIPLQEQQQEQEQSNDNTDTLIMMKDDAFIGNIRIQMVSNGIAYDASTNSMYVTGKNWPTLFKIQVIYDQQAEYASTSQNTLRSRMTKENNYKTMLSHTCGILSSHRTYSSTGSSISSSISDFFSNLIFNDLKS